MRKIAIEEHFTTHTYQAYVQKLVTKAGFSALGKFPQQVEAKLLDLGEARLRDMDEAGIAMQVLLLVSPGLEGIPTADVIALARDINDELADSVRKHPGRFAGFAALPTRQPVAAADELERAVVKLGLKGAAITGTAFLMTRPIGRSSQRRKRLASRSICTRRHLHLTC